MINDSSPMIPRAEDGLARQSKCWLKPRKIEKATVANKAEVIQVIIACLSGYILFMLRN